MTTFDKIRQLYSLPPSENYGFPEPVILDFEVRSDIILPKILRDYYLTLGAQENINSSFNYLLNPVGQIDFSRDNHLAFYQENQGVILWAIKETDLPLDNPPVYATYDTRNLTQTWITESPTTEDFLLYMAVWNGTLGGLKYNANTLNESRLTNELLELIESGWTEIKGITYQEQRFFTDDFKEVISISTNKQNELSGIFIGTTDKSRFLSMIDKLKITFDYRSDEDEDDDA